MNYLTDPIDHWTGEYEFLRNDYSCSIDICGISYPSVEHAFQAMKTTDEDVRREIADESVKKAKQLGRNVNLPNDWGDRRVLVMENLLRQKFGKPEFSDLLVKTDDRLIRMVNDRDDFWGCIYDRDTDSYQGENKLGILLMEIRNELYSLDRSATKTNKPNTIDQSLSELYDCAIELCAEFGFGDIPINDSEFISIINDFAIGRKDINKCIGLFKKLNEQCQRIKHG